MTIDAQTALTARAHALLAGGVPLTLLLDLLDPRGPRSEELYRVETAGRPEPLAG